MVKEAEWRGCEIFEEYNNIADTETVHKRIDAKK